VLVVVLAVFASLPLAVSSGVVRTAGARHCAWAGHPVSLGDGALRFDSWPTPDNTSCDKVRDPAVHHSPAAIRSCAPTVFVAQNQTVFGR